MKVDGDDETVMLAVVGVNRPEGTSSETLHFNGNVRVTVTKFTRYPNSRAALYIAGKVTSGNAENATIPSWFIKTTEPVGPQFLREYFRILQSQDTKNHLVTGLLHISSCETIKNRIY
jgi:hypothetical protein